MYQWRRGKKWLKAVVLKLGVATLLKVTKLLKRVTEYQNYEFFIIWPKKVIQQGILHQRGLQDVFRVARFLSKIVGFDSKKKVKNPCLRNQKIAIPLKQLLHFVMAL